jgi:hypothetical protein
VSKILHGRLIDDGLNGSSVLCVLIGKETYTRRWVDYEILRSIELKMGVFGIRIHQLKHPQNGPDTIGSNPFSYLGYDKKNNDDKIYPMIKYKGGWKDAPFLLPLSAPVTSTLRKFDNSILDTLFSVYDWIDDDGYNNFGNWVESAAKQAGRK